MARAKYTYQIEDVKGDTCIVITDAREGQMSVAKDLDNVVSEIQDKEQLDAAKCLVVYQDEDGAWEGYDVANNHLVSLMACHWMHAINKYRKMLSVSE